MDPEKEEEACSDPVLVVCGLRPWSLVAGLRTGVRSRSKGARSAADLGLRKRFFLLPRFFLFVVSSPPIRAAVVAGRRIDRVAADALLALRLTTASIAFRRFFFDKPRMNG